MELKQTKQIIDGSVFHILKSPYATGERICKSEVFDFKYFAPIYYFLEATLPCYFTPEESGWSRTIPTLHILL